MKSFLNKSLLFCLLLAAGSAGAQPAAPHDTLVAPPAPAPLSSAALPAASIDVSNVSAPSVAGVGVLDEKNGGMPATVWKDTPHDVAASYLSWIRGGIAYGPLRDMTIRLLLSRVTPPAGAGDSWLTERVDALVALGANDRAEELLSAVPESMVNDPLRQARAELLLVRGDVPGACTLQEKGGDAAFWQKLGVICKATSGKRDEALLAVDILRETNAKDETFLQEAVHKIADKAPPMKTLPPRPSVFDVAVIRLAGETMRLKDRLDTIPPAMLRYLAEDASLDPKLREKAESKAISLGLLPVKEGNKPPPTPFATPLASDVKTLLTAFSSGQTAGEADAQVIARLAVDDSAAVQDTRRVQRMLTLLEPFGFRVAPGVWEKLFARKTRFDGDVPPALLLDRLTQAGLSARKGEIIVLSALALGASDIEKTSEIVLLPLVKALLAGGFSKEAHALAYDALQSYSTH